jgi:hypothetical protein
MFRVQEAPRPTYPCLSIQTEVFRSWPKQLLNLEIFLKSFWNAVKAPLLFSGLITHTVAKLFWLPSLSDLWVFPPVWEHALGPDPLLPFFHSVVPPTTLPPPSLWGRGEMGHTPPPQQPPPTLALEASGFLVFPLWPDQPTSMENLLWPLAYTAKKLSGNFRDQ